MYVKLFSKILDSSIWIAPAGTRLIWITLLASMDDEGYAHFSAIENLARRAGVSSQEAVDAVSYLTSPDPDSANPDNEGRRIERVPGGFLILNAMIYRDIVNQQKQREQTRIRVKNFKDKHKSSKNGGSQMVTQGNAPVTVDNAPVTLGNARKRKVTQNASVSVSVCSSIRDIKKNSILTVGGCGGEDKKTQAQKIYKAYPRHVGKFKALHAIEHALKIISFENLIDAVIAFANSTAGKAGSFTPYPATWFNQRRWEDDKSEWEKKPTDSRPTGGRYQAAEQQNDIDKLLARRTENKTHRK